MRSSKEIRTKLHKAGAHFVHIRLTGEAARKRGYKGWKQKPLSLQDALSAKLLGIIPGSVGLAVIDVDVHDGGELQPRIDSVIKALGHPLSQYSTPSGGVHMVYRKPNRKVADTVWKHGEVRADSGFIVMHDEAKILEAVRRVPKAKAVDVSKLPPREKESSPKEGTRNIALNAEAFKLARKGLLNDEKRAELTEKYRAEGLSESEIKATLDSAATAGAANPIQPRKNSEALQSVLALLEVDYRYNLRTHRAEINPQNKGWQPTDDRTVDKLVEQIALRFSYSVIGRSPAPLHYGRDAWGRCFNALLKDKEVDPFLLWLEALPQWDGELRIDKYLIEFFSTGGNDLTRWVSQFLLLGPIQRAYKPGSKLDEMPVLYGPQGIGKSALLRALLPPEEDSWFCDSLKLTSDTKTRAETLQGRVVVEVSEMTGATRADLESLKTFITQQDDGTVRFAYRRDPETMLRRCILAGTSNNEFMLPNDPTGLRRFVPIKFNRAKKAVEPYIEEQREQLWAEALIRYHQGMRGGLPYELRAAAAEVAERHRNSDEVLEDQIAALSENVKKGESLQGIANAMGWEHVLTPAESNRLSAALRVAGWTHERKRIDGKQRRIWSFCNPVLPGGETPCHPETPFSYRVTNV